MIAVTMIPEPFDTFPPNALRTYTMEAGTTVFTPDAPTRGLFYVEEGRVRIVHKAPDGQDVTLQEAGPGDTFAESSLFADSYGTTCIVLEDSVIVRVRKDMTIARLDTDPDFAKAMIDRLSRMLEQQRYMTELLSIRGAEERVLAALTLMGQSGTVIEFAARIGLTHEAVYRALTALVKQGRVVKTGRGRYAAADG